MTNHQWKWGIHFDPDNKVKGAVGLDKSVEEPGFWDEPEQSTRIVRESKNPKDGVDTYQALGRQYEDIQVTIQTEYEKNGSSLIPEIGEVLKQFKETLEDIRTKFLLSGEYDSNNAILRLNAEADGTEPCDWRDILYRMYCRWAENKGFRAHALDSLDGEGAGIKSVTMQIDGENAYGYLRSERGVHRLVHISSFDSAGKRQIPFVPCDVMPNIEEDIGIEVNPDDIRVDTYHPSSADRQRINKTSLAIRITHLPTGIVVTCRSKRSRFQNKGKAMQVLGAKLLMVKQEGQAAKATGIRGDVKDIEWESQIRPYVLQPHTMVKGHRADEESGNIDAVLDGAIDSFISVCLRWMSLGCPDKNVREDRAQE